MIAPDDGVQFALTGKASEVAPIFFEGFIRGLGVGRGNALTSANRLKGCKEFVLRDAKLFEHLGSTSVGILLDGREEEVFDADVLILKFRSFLRGSSQKGLESRSDHGASRRDAWARDFWETGDFRFELFCKAGGLSAQLFDQTRNQAILLCSERVK